MSDEAQKLKDTYSERPTRELEAPAVLGADGVKYKCPLIGDQVLPKEEMRQAIREFLYSQLDEEAGLTACLMIHTLNKDQEKVQPDLSLFSMIFRILVLIGPSLCRHPVQVHGQHPAKPDG